MIVSHNLTSFTSGPISRNPDIETLMIVTWSSSSTFRQESEKVSLVQQQIQIGRQRELLNTRAGNLRAQVELLYRARLPIIYFVEV